MTGCDMADLMPHDPRKLSLIIKNRQNSPGEIDISSWNSEGIHDGNIKDFEIVSQIGSMGYLTEALTDAAKIGSQFRILIDTILLDNLEVRFLAEFDLIGLAQKHEFLFSGHWIGGTGKNPPKKTNQAGTQDDKVETSPSHGALPQFPHSLSKKKVGDLDTPTMHPRPEFGSKANPGLRPGIVEGLIYKVS
jgi:hypothetical protein